MPGIRSLFGKRSKDREARILRTMLNLPGVGGGGATDHGVLTGLDDDDHANYVHLTAPRTIVGQHSFSPSSTQAPFLLGANAQGQLVTGFRADELSKSVIAGAGLATGGVLTSDVTIDHGIGSFGDLHTNYAEHARVETITGAWTWSADLIPTDTDTYDIGSSTKLWRKGWLSELDAILFVSNAIRIEGAWFIVGHNAGTLEEDVDGSETEIDFGISTPGLAVDDFILFRAGTATPKVEYMKIVSSAGGTLWNVTRDVDGSGGDNTWPQGTPFLVLGNTGDGRIELVANQTDSPKISILEQGATYNASTEFVRIGNMRDAYGIGANDFWGLGVGDFSGGNYMKYDDNGGFVVKSGDGAVQIDEEGVKIESGASYTPEDPDEITFYDDPMSAGLVTGGIQTISNREAGAGGYRNLKMYINRSFDESEAMAINMTHTQNTQSIALAGAYLYEIYLDAKKAVYVGTNGLVVGDYDPGTATLGHVYVSDRIFVGAEKVNTGMTTGVTVDQGSASDEVLAFKGSSIAHGMTTIAETDTFGMMEQWAGGSGGLTIRGLSDGPQARGVSIHGYTNTQNTTQTTATVGVVVIDAHDQNGTGVQALGTNGAILTVRNNGTTEFIVTGNGRLFANASQNVSGHDYHIYEFDYFDDNALLNGLRASLAPLGHEMRGRFKEFAASARPILERAGIVVYNDGPDQDGKAFVDMLGIDMLTIDAVRQLHDQFGKRLDRLEQALLEGVTS